jgi:hypothetical protein
LDVDYNIEKTISYPYHSIQGGISFNERNLMLFSYDGSVSWNSLRLCSKLSKGVSDHLLSPFYSFRSIDTQEGSVKNTTTLVFNGENGQYIKYQGFSCVNLNAFVVKKYTDPPKVVTDISFYSNYQMNNDDVVFDKTEEALYFENFIQLSSQTFNELSNIIRSETDIDMVVNYDIGDNTFIDFYKLSYHSYNNMYNYKSSWIQINYATPLVRKVGIDAVYWIRVNSSELELHLNYSIVFDLYKGFCHFNVNGENDYNHCQKGEVAKIKSIYYRVPS